MAFKVLKNETNFKNCNGKLLGRYFKERPNNAEIVEDDTFSKIYDNTATIESLPLDTIIDMEKSHDRKIHENLVKIFKPLASFC